LDYTKKQTKERVYNINAWRYYSEYSVHMYGWFATGWAIDNENSIFYEVAKSFSDADVDVSSWDSRAPVNIVTVIFGIMGI